MITATIPGAPRSTAQQKGIAVRGKRVFVYKKGEVRSEEARMMNALRPSAPPSPLDGAIAIAVRIVFPFSAKEARRHVAHLADNNFTVASIYRPDFDNVLKTLLDVCTKLEFWNDDSQIVFSAVEKLRGTAPRIDLRIARLPDDCLEGWRGAEVQSALKSLDLIPAGSGTGRYDPSPAALDFV